MGFSRDYGLEWDYYEPYELESSEKQSIQDIRRLLARIRSQADEQDKERITNSIEYLEHLEKKIREILSNEKLIGYHNDILLNDYKIIKSLLNDLDVELERISY